MNRDLASSGMLDVAESALQGPKSGLVFRRAMVMVSRRGPDLSGGGDVVGCCT